MDNILQYESSDEEKELKDGDFKSSKSAVDARSSIPLPSKFYDLYNKNPRMIDPVFHQGRIRTTPHIEGQWPCHVYIEWIPDPNQRGILRDYISRINSTVFKSTLQSLVESDVGVLQPLHISLSDLLMSDFSTKENLVNDIKDCLSKYSAIKVPLLGQPALFINSSKTRGFVILPTDSKQISEMISSLNEIATKYQFPVLDSTKPHISIAWFDSQDSIPHLEELHLTPMEIEVTTVKIKVGHQVRNVSLAINNQ